MIIISVAEFKEMWYQPNIQNGSTVWGFVLIGLFYHFLAILMYYLMKEAVIEYGYPKTKRKALKKRIKSFSILQRILLFQLIHEAKHVGLYLYYCGLRNLLTIIVSIACFVGQIAVLVTSGVGWARCLIMGSHLYCVVFFLILSIPDVINLPSERRRYFK